LEQNTDKAIREAKEFFENIRMEINVREAEVLGQIGDISQLKGKKLGLQREALQFYSDNVKYFSDYGSLLIKEGLPSEILREHDKILKSIKKAATKKPRLPPVHNSEMQFLPTMSDFPRGFGLVWSQPTVSVTPCPGIGRCLVVHPYDEGFIFAGNQGKIFVSSKDGVKKTLQIFDNQQSIRGICMSLHSIYVCAGGSNQVIVSTTESIQQSFDLNLDHPHGMVLRDGLILIANRGKNEIKVGKIWSESQTGKDMTSFGKDGVSLGQMRDPIGLAVIFDGALNRPYYAVSEWRNHRIQIFDQNYKPIRIIGKKGSKPGELLHPWHVAVDDKNRIYVADCGNHRVQIFSELGHLLGVVELGEKSQPSGIAINKGKVCVTDYNMPDAYHLFPIPF